jgi:hypothetical protein
VLSAWGSYTNADVKGSGGDNGDIWSYAVAAAFPDLGGKGNLGGIIVGAAPYLGNPDSTGAATSENKIPLHVEGFYKFQVNNFISVTPGIIYLTNQNQSSNTDDVIIGTIRTTFKF